MNIFGGKGKEELREEILRLEKLVTDLRDATINAQISESRMLSGYNAQQESDRAKNEIEVASLRRVIEQLEADFNDKVVAFQNSTELDFAKRIQSERVVVRKELRAEFGSELESLKKQVKELTTDSSKNKGLYDGALLVIKSLEMQLYKSNDLNEKLVKAFPEVKANFSNTPTTVQVDNHKN